MDGHDQIFDLTSGAVEFARYRVVQQLRQDALSEEYLAVRLDTLPGQGTPIVLRCLRPAVAAERSLVTVFLGEYGLLGGRGLTNIPRLLAATEKDSVPYVARLYERGSSLEQVMATARKSGRNWPVNTGVWIAAELFKALEKLHLLPDVYGQEANFRHGDIRPENIWLTAAGDVRLTNLGSSFYLLVDSQLQDRWTAQRGAFAPDGSALTDQPTVQGDLYGVAAVLWTLLTGTRPPVECEADFQERLIAELSPSLKRFFLRAFCANREERFLDAREAREVLMGSLQSSSVGFGREDLAGVVEQNAFDEMQQRESLLQGENPRPCPGDTQLIDRASMVTDGVLLDGRYRLGRRLGEGGMGVIYEAEHLGLGRRLAIKVLHEKALDDPILVERFRREGRIVGSIAHPNVVRVFDFGTTAEGQLYLAMELLEGESLGRRMSRGPVPPKELIKIMIGVCRGLQAAHDAGIVHRDLKPDNIFLTLEGPKLLDFGIARHSGLADADTTLTKTGHICGTAEYISPEQVRGQEPDCRSDLFSLGVIMYEGLTGRSPFRGKSVGDVLDKLLNLEIEPPRKVTGDLTIPPELSKLCTHALARPVDERFQSAEEMGWALLEMLPQDERPITHPMVTREGATTPGFIAGASVRPSRPPIPVGRQIKNRLASMPRIVSASLGILLGIAVVAYCDSRGAFDGIEEALSQAGSSSARGAVLLDRADSAPRHEPSVNAVSGRPVANAPSTDVQEPSESEILVLSRKEARVAAATSAKAGDQKKGPRERARRLVSKGNKALAGMELDKARQYFAEALRLSSRESSALFGLGKVAYQQGDLDQAVGTIERALSRSPGRASWRVYLGRVFMKKRDRSNAVKQWRRVLVSDPDNNAARSLLAKAGEAVE